ncbi:glucose-1-phosphate thymidylyltransferase [bacterium]|nr:glucose-1-phosphate thymidylyltransferase [bacterium]
MGWKNLSTYFGEQPPEFIKKLFTDCEYPWSLLNNITREIELSFSALDHQGKLPPNKKFLKNPDCLGAEGSFHFLQSAILEENFVDPDLKISIGLGTLVEAGSTIKNHTIIGNNCEIRQGAYIRGNSFIGPHSVVGHTTEIKDSIFINHVEAGHFAYIGNSIVGSFVNLGAGVKISNLEFRSLDAKQKERFPELIFSADGQTIKTGLSKFGAIIGDGCEIGCNSVLCPLTLLGSKSWILPNTLVLKGFHQQGSLLMNLQSPRRL